MENYILAEGKFGVGLLPQEKDERDFAFSAVTPFDWELGFDIELLLGYRALCKDEDEFFGKNGRSGWGYNRYKEIVEEVKKNNIPPFIIPVKNQGQSSSCTGQALATYLSVLNFIETGKWVEISAKDIYAYISLGENRGAYLRDALKLACDRGIGTEKIVPSYYADLTPLSERDFLIKPDETEELKAIRRALQSKEFQLASRYTENRMDIMAWQMLLGFGTYFGVDGENNGTWTTEYPQPPVNISWGHALYGAKAGIDFDFKNYISHINSWSKNVGVKGWQKLKANYFEARCVNTPWTLIDKNNSYNLMTKTNVKIIKDSNSPAVGIWLPALSQEALESLCLNFGIEIPKKEDGSIDWNAWIDGTLILQ